LANATQTTADGGSAADAVRHEFDAKARSQTSIILGRFVRHRLAMVSLGVLVLLALVAIVVPFFLPYNFADTSSGGYLTPSARHLLGTDQLGRDGLAQLLRGTQFSLLSNLLVLQTPALSVLAEAMDMERTTLTRNLRPLITAGWVTVQPGASARRREARLTPIGRAKWEQGKSLWRLGQNALNASLGEAEVARLHQMVDQCLPLLRNPVRGGH